MITLAEYKALARQPRSSQGWRYIGLKCIYARSKWEANFARYLHWQKLHRMILDWEHEPKTFWFLAIKRGVRSYLPDFSVTNLNGSTIYFEVKGFYDRKSLTKIKRFRKYYPDEKLIVIDKRWFAKHNVKMRQLIREWE